MARYIIEEMPDLQKTGKRITYPKFGVSGFPWLASFLLSV